MPRSRSASVDIIPPAGSRQPGLAAVMEAAYRSNNDNTRKAAEEDDVDDADGEADEIEDDAPPLATKKRQPPDFSHMPNAPVPCDRCVKSSKTCKGVSGSRCENCKRLKQKCTNSTGPARGKQAGATATATGTKKALPAPKAGTSKAATGEASTSNQKRKSPPRDEVNGDTHSIDGEGSIDYEEGHEPPPRLNKKRRLSKGTGPTRAQLVKAVTDMEASVRRIQASVSKEVDKMTSVINSLNAKIKDMSDD